MQVLFSTNRTFFTPTSRLFSHPLRTFSPPLRFFHTHTPTFSPARPSFSVFFTRFRFFRPHQLATSEIFAPRAPFFLLPSFGTPLSPHKPLSPLSPHKPLSPIAFFFLGASLLALANTLAFFLGGGYWLTPIRHPCALWQAIRALGAAMCSLRCAHTPTLFFAAYARWAYGAGYGYVLTSLRAYAYAAVLCARATPLRAYARLFLRTKPISAAPAHPFPRRYR